MIYLKTYLAMLVAFLLIDSIWLGFIAKNMYQKYIGHLMTDQVVWGAAALFYALYLAGTLYFAVLPAGSLQHALVRGALLGGLCYATYDLTNWATLREWPAALVGIDIIWGMALTGAVAAVGWWAYSSL